MEKGYCVAKNDENKTEIRDLGYFCVLRFWKKMTFSFL